MGTLVPCRGVIVGGDVRLSTPALKEGLIEGLLSSGAEVLDIGTVPTPAFYYARQHLGIDAGVMITASHNPPEFNGFKIVLGPLPITEEELAMVGDLVRSGCFLSGEGHVREIELLPLYESHLLGMSPGRPPDCRRLTLTVDAGNGCYSAIAPGLLRKLGYDVDELHCQADGAFPNRSPNSAVPANLAALCARVRETGADLGVAFDGDGDRVSFVDERGTCLPSDKAIVLLARHLLGASPGRTVVYDLKCSSAVPESIEAAGGIAIPERSGHTFIKTRMIQENALFGGEISGHFFYGALRGGDDGLYTAAVMAHVLATGGGKMSELADSVPSYSTTPDLRVEFRGDRETLVERIARAFPADSVSRLDGVRVQFPEGWGLARVSVTEPAITLRFEARTEEDLQRIMTGFLSPVPELKAALSAKGKLQPYTELSDA